MLIVDRLFVYPLIIVVVLWIFFNVRVGLTGWFSNDSVRLLCRWRLLVLYCRIDESGWLDNDYEDLRWLGMFASRSYSFISYFRTILAIDDDSDDDWWFALICFCLLLFVSDFCALFICNFAHPCDSQKESHLIESLALSWCQWKCLRDFHYCVVIESKSWADKGVENLDFCIYLGEVVSYCWYESSLAVACVFCWKF